MANFLAPGRQTGEICREYKVLCIINDRPDIAAAADADGVHLGQEDLPPLPSPSDLGKRKIMGSARTSSTRPAVPWRMGPITSASGRSSKVPPNPATSWPDWSMLPPSAPIAIPKVGIAGIGLENVDQVLAAGISAMAVTAAVVGCEDVAGAAREMKKCLMK